MQRDARQSFKVACALDANSSEVAGNHHPPGRHLQTICASEVAGADESLDLEQVVAVAIESHEASGDGDGSDSDCETRPEGRLFADLEQTSRKSVMAIAEEACWKLESPASAAEPEVRRLTAWLC